MMFRSLLVPLALFSSVLALTGCKNGSTQPTNPFAQNLTIPPPATFSSQESYLGQTPGSFVPQPPASTFPQPGAISPTQPAVSPTDIPSSDSTHNNVGEGATLFTAASRETGWSPVEVVTTSQTAFQVMDARTSTVSSANSVQTGTPESLIVGASHVVTTIMDEGQPTATLNEPQVLYSGKYTE